MEQIAELVAALQARAWYPVAGIAAAVLIKLIQFRTKWLTDNLPQKVQWLPAASIMVLGAFVDAYTSGVSWQTAGAWTFYAAIAGTPTAVGSHHIGKRITPKRSDTTAPPPSSPRKSGPPYRTAAAAIACLLFVGGCSPWLKQTATETVKQALPTLIVAIDTGDNAVAKFRNWVKKFEAVPAVAGQASDIDAVLSDAQQSFSEARKLAGKGRDFAEQAKRLYLQGWRALDRARAMLEAVNLWGDGKLLAHPESAARAMVGVDVELPPEQLEER